MVLSVEHCERYESTASAVKIIAGAVNHLQDPKRINNNAGATKFDAEAIFTVKYFYVLHSRLQHENGISIKHHICWVINKLLQFSYDENVVVLGVLEFTTSSLVQSSTGFLNKWLITTPETLRLQVILFAKPCSAVVISIVTYFNQHVS